MILPSQNRPGKLGPRTRPGLRALLRRLHRAEADLRTARQAAEFADRARFELLARVDRQVRAPLNAILGMTDAALDGPLDPASRECLDVVKSAGESLLSFVKEIGDDGANETCPPDAPAPSPLNILLVDDDRFDQRVGTYKLKKQGHEVWIAGSGTEALCLVESARFDLIVMDIEMKEMDGLEATRRLRQRERDSQAERRTPILAVSARAMIDDRQRCRDCGMDGFLSKPIRDRELRAAIQSLVQPDPTRSRAAVPTTCDPRTVLTFNLEKSRERVGGNLELLDELIATFREDCPPLMAEIDTAVSEGDAPALCHSAHTLKSMLLFFEATEASHSALRLESMGRTGDLTEARDVFSALAESVALVLQVFSEQGPSLS